MRLHEAKRSDSHTTSLEDQIITRNKEKVVEAMEEVNAFAEERKSEFQLVLETTDDYKSTSRVFIECNVD
ncbi:hypothetical protein GOP47_0019476 [Adiantum capillus-veneris]|uniref:Uncharacterized protein n=1 Tax=Adiantum capillus-veneris TaxID=13818 RepID=A0A9D4Z9N1_ADICA|nr:hypothetical protein GOP47_0019476 [Adiantum capillus-veneris]